ncbi:glutathionylspermidine synthase family protein [Xanthomonas maliensis]|uniref:glutathionylspermidine synthase family protein n=1 Tax=Xanthomonas maliensis TaxID=1321368 RepID=UPI00039E38A5|nr:glutathionylspermidine synthase family protein [Xanthomonas maliensis]KAB7763770.1 glutathionylspermidine synthase family protein [Xanthomonas maliensis]
MRRIAIAERPDWRDQAESLGFHFHTIDGEPYWDEQAYYAFSLRQIEDDIEAPTQELHDMAMQLVDEVVGSDALLSRLAIPAFYWDWIAASWKNRDPHLYGRMDLAYAGDGPAKLYELNYDTPTSLYEAAYFQWLWLEQRIADGALPPGTDQYNLIQDLLCETLGTLALDGAIGPRMHFSAVRDSLEDQATVRYLRDCAHQVGIATEEVAIEDIGLSAEGWFTDTQDQVIHTLFKLYPLEFMMEERFGPALCANRVRLIEPAWKAVLSNKGILPLLWERHQGHPNLLPARFADGNEAPSAGWVRKPLLSREGANIALVTAQGLVAQTDGPYPDGPAILQAHHPLPVFAGRHALVGSWVVADRAAGLGMRDDDGPITRDSSRFVPHVIVD